MSFFKSKLGGLVMEFESRGKVVEFEVLTGEVVGSEKYSETHVTSSGGGGYVGGGGGYVSAPTVSSSTVINHEFWLRSEGGREVPVRFKGVEIPLRQGQKISLISVGRKGAGDKYYTTLINHQAGRHWSLNDFSSIQQKLKLERVTGVSAMIVLAVIWGIVYYTAPEIGVHRRSGDIERAWLDASWGLAFSVVIPFVLYRYYSKNKKINKVKDIYESTLKKLIDGLYEKSGG